jgi:fructose-1,6-bisphosphatase/inositol monophosphatase family enzyme
MSYSPLLNILTIAIEKVANTLTRDFYELEFLQKNLNSAENFAQKTILNLEEKLYEDLHKFRNKYSFILSSGEIIKHQDESNYFILNPIIGLNNFIRGIPSFAVSIGVKRDSKPYAGAILNPITKELFIAELGVGSFYNSKRVTLNPHNKQRLQLKSHIIATDRFTLKNLKKTYNYIISQVKQLDLCYYSINKIDAITYEESLHYDSFISALSILESAEIKLNYNLDKEQNIITNLNSLVDGEYDEIINTPSSN